MIKINKTTLLCNCDHKCEAMSELKIDTKTPEELYLRELKMGHCPLWVQSCKSSERQTSQSYCAME